jgi:hypothetical protein
MAELWNTDSGAAAHGVVMPLEITPLAFQALADYLETVAKARPIVEDEQDEGSALRALLDVYEDRVEEAENGTWAMGPTLDIRPEGGTTLILRAARGLLMAPFVVAGYAGLVGLILPIVMLRNVFGGRGWRQQPVGMRARATEPLLGGRSEPFPATA